MRDSAPAAAGQSNSGLAVRYLRGVGPVREAMLTNSASTLRKISCSFFRDAMRTEERSRPSRRSHPKKKRPFSFVSSRLKPDGRADAP